MIRSPIICVMGHVDHGKTAILDYVRGTAVKEGEAGAITQHVGASFIPTDTIKEQSRKLLGRYGYGLDIPGLMFIDTPGHQAFTSLRKRGGKTAELAVLVIDITQGVQPQTEEALDILKKHKCPFIIAANKIDKIQGWRPNQGESFSETIKKQSERAREHLDDRMYEIIGDVASKEFNSQRFDKAEDPEDTILIIPTSAETGEGIPELLMFLAALSQKYMKESLDIETESPGKGTILEVKEVKGLGKTIDVILDTGKIKKGDKIVLGTKDGAIETKIRALLEPRELEEMREARGNQFKRVEEVNAAAGVKIAAPDLENAIPGLTIRVVSEENVEEVKQEIESQIKKVEIENDKTGVIVKADTIGSLEGVTDLFQGKDISIRRANIGKVKKKDLIEAESIKKDNRYLGAIFAFNTEVPEEIEEEAKEEDIQIFQSDIVYELEKQYKEWKEKEEKKAKQERLEEYTYPAKIKIMPEHTFRKSKPAVVGVKILQGKLKPSYRLINQDGKKLGEVESIQVKEENIDLAEKGDEVAVAISNVTVGRQIEEGETLYTDVSVEETYDLEEEGFKNKQLIREIRRIKR